MSSVKMLALAVVLVVSSCSLANADSESEYVELWNRTIQSMTSPPETVSAQALSCQGAKFAEGFCDLPYRAKADSVHLLTPADIGVVAALGDSITAGFGARATGIFDFFREARGVSWSIGGDIGDYTECATIPNILRHFNPDVYGAATGYGSSGANLDVAVSGAKSDGIYSQAETLVAKLQSMPDKMDEWKLVTLWIGGNDLCQKCEDNNFSPENYLKNIYNTLSYLKENLPRTLVNVPLILDVTKLAETTGLICGAVHLFACDCANSGSVERTSERAREYMEALKSLEDSPLNDRDDFAVVVQPFFENLSVPHKENGDVDMSFFAPDCFHMSTLGHRGFAVALWNNMITAEKETDWVAYDPVLECPDLDYPYIYTSQTQAKVAAMQAEKDGGFGAESLPGDQGRDSPDSGWGLGQIFGMAIGGAAIAYLAVVVVGVAIGGTVWVRRRRRLAGPDSEAIPLVKRL